LDFECISLKHYFGSGHGVTITIPNTIERLDSGCFCENRTILNVIFESGSKLSFLERSAFRNCSSLSSICIPSSVETVGDYCFCRCKSLSTVTFESGSKLSSIGTNSFFECSSLSSIWCQSSLKTIPTKYRTLVKGRTVAGVAEVDAVMSSGDWSQGATINGGSNE
jgi:hypothetical protein